MLASEAVVLEGAEAPRATSGGAGSPESVGRRLLVIDGHAYAYRAFFAIRSLNAPDGKPTNAIYGFIKMIEKLRSWLRPSHEVVVWDGGLAADRLRALPGYKAERPAMPDHLASQIEQIESFLVAAGIPTLSQDGVEADDWIARLALAEAGEGAEVVIASTDKDFMQLVSGRIGLVNANDKTETVWTAEQVRAKTGVEPAQIVDWLSLIGDSVDNIPGVPGIGPKTAAELLTRFGSVAEIFRRLPEVKSERVRSNLAAHADAVRRNLELIRLRAELCAEVPSDSLKRSEPDWDRLRELFQNWGFRGMLRELDERRPQQPVLF